MQSAVPGREILSAIRANDYRRWLGRDGDEKTAAHRFGVEAPYFIHHTPKFRIDRSESIFTIGSCFARNVEQKLVKEGVDIVLKGHGVPNERYQRFGEPGAQPAGGVSRGAMNKYSTHSISNELHRTLLDIEYPDLGLIEVSDGLWYDPHASALKPAGFEECADTRHRIADATRQIFRASTVFITLGLTETWIDTATDMVVNVPPAPVYLRKLGDRFAFFNAGFLDSYEAMEKTIRLVREKCRPDMKFVVTVSPVPLGATHTNMDVVTANTYSKSVLRAVAQTLAQNHDFVDYFPSYEMVTNTPRALAWQEDQLHVNPSLVESVVSRFVELYFDAPAAERESGLLATA